ncbi:MAG: integrase, partial [Acidimicrobiales bacterium]
HVEQKNWTHVRELVGYLRFDTDAELDLLNRIWALDHRYTNYLLTQQKLTDKQRIGARVVKRHDRAATPFARAMARTGLSEGTRDHMAESMATIRPGDLFRQIYELTRQLERLAISKAPAPVKPRVNRAFNA